MLTSRQGWAPGTGDAGDDAALLGLYDPSTDPTALPPVTAPVTAFPNAADGSVASGQIVQPVAPTGYVEDQLDGYTYGPTTVYGSNVIAAWQYSTGLNTSVALIDDGFNAATTALYGNFSRALSRSFAVGSLYPTGGGSSSNIGEPPDGYHGTTTSGLIGDSGANGLPVGVAPNAEIIGVKVTFGDVAFSTFVDALQYAGSVADVINNSWAFEDYGVGEPTDLGDFGSWYSALDTAVEYGRGGLGDIVVFAAGNDRADANTVALQPINANPDVIAVAASDADGLVASYSNPGPGLLVAAIGDNDAVPLPGGFSFGFGSGTSYAAPTVSAIASLMLSVNPNLGWRDVQEILADSAYAPPPSAIGFTTNRATSWNGGGMQFSEDLGFGVVDANVAVNLARAWTEQSTSASQVSQTVTDITTDSIAPGAGAVGAVTITADIRVQQVEVTITDTGLLAAGSELLLISPDGTASVLLDDAGLVGGTDLTDGLDLTGSVIDDNAFWGENASGTWALEVANTGTSTAVLQDWSLTVLGDNAATVATPLVYTPEFASLATTHPARTEVDPGTANTIDLIALPSATSINLNATTGTIDGVAVTLDPGLLNANADGSTGSVTLVGLAGGGSELTGGDGPTTITGYGGDTINGGLGATTITTDAGATDADIPGAGGSVVTLSTLAPAATQDTITSGGGDTIWAGSGTVSITDTGSNGDTVFDQSATLTFINGSGASVLYAGSGTVLVQAGAGGGVYFAGTGPDSQLTAGTGKVVFYGGATGDVLTAAGGANDVLIAGAGSESLVGGAATDTVVMLGGSGNDLMTAGDGHTDFTVGTGNDTITDGGLSDVITFARGDAGGLDVINDFRAGTDKIGLVGYSASTASKAISSQISDGMGGALLFLSDGTRIDLIGITHATSSVFT